MRRRLVWLVIAAAAGGAALLAAVLLLANLGGEERRLTVGATADERVEPDMATLSFGVSARAQSARSAMRSASRSLEAVVAAVRRAGADEIRTRPVRVSRPAEPPPGRPLPYPRPFEATQSIAVRVLELERLGGLIDAAVEAGATDVSGPRFGVADPRAVRRRLVADAVAEARRSGRAMAEAEGLELGRAIRITERSGPRPLPVQQGRQAADAAPPIEPGSIAITAAVSVTFALSGA